MDFPDPQSTTDIGTLGENFVADWLQSQGAIVLAQQWTCRFGELDLVIQTDDIVAFVEVKTRSRGNWDSDGLLAVTPQKQQKILIAAQLFLLQHPDLAELPCRFDVALVRYQSQQKRGNRSIPSHLTSFQLQDYMQGAFC